MGGACFVWADRGVVPRDEERLGFPPRFLKLAHGGHPPRQLAAVGAQPHHMAQHVIQPAWELGPEVEQGTVGKQLW